MTEDVFKQYDLEWGTLFLKDVAGKHETIVESTFSKLIEGIEWHTLEDDVLNDISMGIYGLYKIIRVCMRLLKDGMKFVDEKDLISEISAIWEEYDLQWVSKAMRENIPDFAFEDFANLGDYVRRVDPTFLDLSDSSEFVQMCTFWNRAVSLLRRMEVELKEQLYRRKMALVMSLHKRLGETATIGVLGEDIVKLLCNYVK